jgi:superfamily II DNA or RNA helicase
MAGRTVRSKWWRRQLEVDAGGHCYLCGGVLGEDWEPDHVEPWALGGETVPSNIRPACRPCNRRKGVMRFRGFQLWLHERFQDVEAGILKPPSEIVLDVGCGAGKSVAVLIIAYWLIERVGVCDRLIWVVPNGSLRRQAAKACGPNEVAAKLLGHHIEIVESTNQGNPAKGHKGYVLTYAATAAARRMGGDCRQNPHVEELSKLRYVGVWDEPHHMTTGGDDYEARGYASGVAPLNERVKVRVFMSGTLSRHDRRPIAFLEYGDDGLVSKAESDDRWFRKYPLREAIDDQAVIRTEFYLSDGTASWMYAGQPYTAESIKEDRAALWSALQTEFADRVLSDCVKHWRGWRGSHPRSKLLVICANVKQAARAHKLLAGLGLTSDIATYKEDDADERIERFKIGDVDALVTVAKAYEGLDVPSISHIACLTHIRSLDWIHQAIARAWRFDYSGEPYPAQRAFVFAPADSLFQQIIDWIWEEFRHGIAAYRDHEGTRGTGVNEPEERPVITPDRSDKTDTVGKVLGGESWDSGDMGDLLSIQEEVMSRGLAPVPLDQLAAIVEVVRAGEREPVHASPRANGNVYRTPGERLRLLRRDLSTNVGAAAGLMSRESGLSVGECAEDINRRIVAQWRKRDLMEEDELAAAISWVRQFYGVE